METTNIITNVLKQIEEQGYNMKLVEFVIVGERYNLTYNEYHKTIEVHLLSHEYWQKIKSKHFEENGEYEFLITYGGERSSRPPGENVLCKMSPEKRARVLERYK